MAITLSAIVIAIAFGIESSLHSPSRRHSSLQSSSSSTTPVPSSFPQAKVGVSPLDFLQLLKSSLTGDTPISRKSDQQNTQHNSDPIRSQRHPASTLKRERGQGRNRGLGPSMQTSPVSVAVCTKKICLTESLCELCERYAAPDGPIDGPTAIVSVREGPLAGGKIRFVDASTGKPLPAIELKSGREFAISMTTLQFEEPYEWNLEAKDWSAKVDFFLTLKRLEIPKCLQEKQLSYGVCPKVNTFGTFYGKNRVELHSISECFRRDSHASGEIFGAFQSFPYFEDGCSPSWMDSIDELMEKDLHVSTSNPWKTSFVLTLDEAKKQVGEAPADGAQSTSKRMFTLVPLDEKAKESATGFLKELFRQLSRNRPQHEIKISVQAVDGAPPSTPLYILARINSAMNEPSYEYLTASIARHWPGYTPQTPISDLEERSVLSFVPIKKGSLAVSDGSQSCQNDFDCQSLCCNQGFCAQHDPQKNIKCSKPAGSACLASEFCMPRKGLLSWSANPRPRPNEPVCRLSTYNSYDECVDFKCIERKSEDFFPYPLTTRRDPQTHMVIQDEQYRREFNSFAFNPQNCP